MVLTAGNDTVKSLWVRIKGQTSMADVIMGVCQDLLSRTVMLMSFSLRDVSKLTTLVLMGDFSLANVTWEYHTANTDPEGS